jgi:acetyl/propionyl-CoA carboxylase alpha subunit
LGCSLIVPYRLPAEGPRPGGAIVRNDIGLSEGGEISMYSDPMIAKLCTWLPGRQAAIDAMAKALDRFEAEGIGHIITQLLVKEADTVEAGQALATVEAMKMENMLKGGEKSQGRGDQGRSGQEPCGRQRDHGIRVIQMYAGGQPLLSFVG